MKPIKYLLKQIKNLINFYGWNYPRALAHLLAAHRNLGSYLGKFWSTKDFSLSRWRRGSLSSNLRSLAICLYGLALAEITAGIYLIYLWYAQGLAGGWAFGLSLIVAYPLVLAHLVAVLVILRWLAHPKQLGRAVVCRILESQVRHLRRRHKFDVIAVAGSVGKTSSKMAIAKVLQASRRVLWQEGNYNDRVTVPLIFFDQVQPALFNLFAWLRIFWRNERTIRRVYPYQVVVIELGTDGPGFMKEFAYTKPDIAVLTAIAPEHMEYFGTLGAVAAEELVIFDYARQVLINVDDTSAEYLKERDFVSYGLHEQATYYAVRHKSYGVQKQHIKFYLAKDGLLELKVPLLGEQGAKITLAAAATAHLYGLPVADIARGVSEITAFAGRMQILSGVKESTIIDDTYNSSPVATKAALDVLQSGEAPQRVAILGSMNELGNYSKQAHEEVAEHCDPAKLDLVVTIGQDAKKYLAPVAKKRGCKVKTFLDPTAAGRYAKKQLKTGAVILAKGSQNGVFAEEAVKVLLANSEDASKLVRQSAAWLTTKRKQFRK